MANKKVNATVNNALANKLKRKADERVAEFKNPYIDDKMFVSFPAFRAEHLDGKVELACITKLKKHVKDDNGNNVVDENGEFVWENLYAFIDARYPDVWSYGGSALRAIYNDLVDDDLSEEDLNNALSENPITFKLVNKKLENGRNKGKIMVQWVM